MKKRPSLLLTCLIIAAGVHTAILISASAAHPEGSPHPPLLNNIVQNEVGRSVPLSRDRGSEEQMRIAGVHGARDEETTPVRLVPEWELTGPVVLVWPEHLRRQRALVEPYSELIRRAPTDWEVAVISPSPPSMRALQHLGREVRYLPMKRVRNVHIRDWSGLPAVDADGRLFAAQFRYRPKHLARGDAVEARDSEAVGRQLGESLYGAVREIPLVLSGSAITHNGKGAAIVSQRVIAENEHLSIETIRQQFREHAGITRLVFVPVRPGDEDGRLTGLIRFASENVVLIARHTDEDAERTGFTDRLADQVRRELGRDYRIVRLPQLQASAISYLDYIALHNRVWAPVFGRPEDEMALNMLRQALPDREIIPMDARIVSSLANEELVPSLVSVTY